MVWYFRHLIVRPVMFMTRALEEVASGEGDLSRDLPLLTHDQREQCAQQDGVAQHIKPALNLTQCSGVQ
ncbi:hypothetical protein ALO44_200186 [Pseudomonas syringae pv. tagetis]|uniref:Uncharacterized protein n=2 Tax=Pseudomonas syringae group TaxID=136849 RepID=A0A0Q0HFK9_9PSED|nr:hypothetical protein ALO44_200186 [Pseudomonas syringae pv. tagetis]